MLFNSLQYGIFFIAVFVLHWMLPQRLRRPFLLVASFYFYASFLAKYLLLIIGLTVFNYFVGLWIGRAAQPKRKRLLWLAVAGNLGSLAYFKYTELFLSTIQPVLKHLPLMGAQFQDPLLVKIILPIGISFFVFEFIHYAAEVYKGMEPERNPVDFALFPAFFPTQIAGPIKRFPDWVKQLHHPLKLREVDIDGGIGLILRGLLKKIIIADIMADAVNKIFAHPGQAGWATTWFAIFGFALQIYGDFSGYTDIGRGCAQLLGYGVPENFASPYQAANPAEFWHRWHMSLSTWLRDYLYIPLGGSRVSQPRVYLNLMITMALGGLWHGAQWHFMVWGVYQGVLLCGHRLWDRSMGRTATYKAIVRFPLSQFVTRIFTLVLVCLGWLLFRADTLTGAFQMLGAALNFSQPAWAGFTEPALSTPILLMYGAAAVVFGGWIWSQVKGPALQMWGAATAKLDPLWISWTTSAVLRPAVYTLAIAILVLWPPHSTARFIYFQF
ncbi:MAG: putative poly(beta-D-mannuronate) O-acetylase [Ktedonobacterales bacterium]|jgi:D-alanyl-lipoteichoic acid acyltransferase DltB (MBOAT superfamily)|nr:MAG: putative poly(beta-D-mannuronate) O-acetylase [Ktedonobacterales bacterium]